MESTAFKVNSRIELLFENNLYKSNIQDIDKNYISISIPINDSMYVALNVGDVLEVLYYEGKELYRFKTKVAGRKIDKIPLILIYHPEHIERFQRRNFVRVPVVKYVDCTKINENSLDIDEILRDKNNKQFKATLLDISGSGARISFKEEVKVYDRLLLIIPIENDEIFVQGEVVRIENDSTRACGINFVDVSSRTRDKIIRLTFEIMRNMRNKGIKED
jgi:c-di-GMP-binding flagellar brake protein YcgR